MIRSIARDLHVTGNGKHLSRTLWHDVQPPAVPELADRTAKAHGFGLLRLRQQPRPAEILPVVRQLDLLAVDDALAENPQLIADGVTCGRNVERRHGIEIARGKAAEAAVAEARVRLTFEDVRCTKAQLVERLRQYLADAKVEGVFHQAAAHQKFHRQVVYLPAMFRAILAHAVHAALSHHIAQDKGARAHHLRVARLFHCAAKADLQLFAQRFFHVLHRVNGHRFVPFFVIDR